MYEKGAHFAIGWKGNIQNGKAARWVTLFFDYSSRGKSVYDAMKYADKESYAGPTYYAGDTFQVLTR